MPSFRRFVFIWTVAASTVVAAGQDAATQQPGAVAVTAGNDTDLDALRQWDATVDRMTRNGALVVNSRLVDRTLRGRAHEYLAQTIDGVPVLGGGISRQLDAAGATVSLLGTLRRNIDVDTAPALSTTEAVFLLERAQGGRLVADPRP